MSILNFFKTAAGKVKRKYSTILICIFIILMFTLSFLNIYDISNHNNSENINITDDYLFDHDLEGLENAADVSMLQNPFIINFDAMRTFFINKYESSLNLDVPLYYREGDSTGNILDDTIYSEDNLHVYSSLMHLELNPTETYDIYLKLKSTPLWYEDGNGQYDYGFVKSVDNSTGQVKNDIRYLADNILPIFLLIENIGEDIDDILINGKKPVDSIEEMFSLVNSTTFWDEPYDGFAHTNSTTKKYSISNFYAILANLLIHRTYDLYSLNEAIKNRAYDLGNKTMYSISNNMWDTTDKAFYHNADRDWDTSGPGQKYYHLDVNALGLMTLLEFWVGSGKENDSTFKTKATQLYNSLDNNLWNDINKLYHNVSQPNWNIIDFDYDLRANALMLEACVRFFQLTGNITYYNRAIELYNKFENDLYDNINNAYDFSLTDNDKNFNSNLQLIDAYLEASETYSSTVLNASYNNTSTIPNFVFNQDTMNITSVYAFEKTETYYNLTTNSYLPFTTSYNISDADINYLFKYPNGTFLYQYEHQILSPDDSHTLIHTIEETLPIEEGYYIYIWANKSYFSVGNTIKRFNVFGGLINDTIEGLVSLLYQGPIVNVSLPINYTRKDNLTLMASLEGKDIINFTAQEVNFTANSELIELIYVDFNLTARPGAFPGFSEIIFKIYQGDLIYLEVKKIIEIGYSFDYEHLLYQSQVVPGENIYVSLDLINFLPNATQSLNISFTGITEPSIELLTQEEILGEKQIKAVSYNLKTLETIVNDIITIEMNVLQNTTIYYTEILIIEIIPKFEVLSVSFPSDISQGSPAYFISNIKNNLEDPVEFSLYVNGKIVESNIDALFPGENRIVKSIIPTSNPYEFGVKTYEIIIEDSENEEIARFYFKVTIELSTFNLVIFYLLPCIVPIGIILYFLNKQIKHNKLRR
jgi:hypothetical protein